jgi:GTP cyclohydrolase I
LDIDWGERELDQSKIRTGITFILDGLGLDLSDPNFEGTPDRVVRSYMEIFAGLDENVDFQIEQILERTFPCDHQQMIVARQLEIFSMCPHHLLPVHYNISVAYLPGKGEDAKVLGLSKLVRLTELLAARPVLQEQVVNDVTAALMWVPGCIGAGCIAHGAHFCMRMRGVGQTGSVVTTTSLRGEFLTDQMVRSEFLDLVR